MSNFDDILRLSGKKLSEEQLAAVNSKCATIVSAGAGSGKTTVLSFRFLKLVCDGVDADRILTLTFTKKAAAEMYERIHGLLSSAVRESGDANLKKQLEHNFPKSSISTMDSFWSEIARCGCLKYGIARDFSILSDDDATDMSNKIVDTLASDETLIDSYDFLSSNCSQDEIYGMFNKLSKHMNVLSEYTVEDLDLNLDRLWLILMSKSSVAKQMESILDSIGEYRQYSTDKGLFAFGDFDYALECFKAKNYEVMPKLGKKYKGTKKDWKIVTRLIDEYNRVLLVLVSSKFISIALDDEKRLSRLFVAFANRINEEKRSRGMFSFSDVEAIAKSTLIDNRQIRNYYKSRFDYIMVDEFQDNNEEQKEILYLLSEDNNKFSHTIPKAENIDKNKLFFVGDDKQSIYRFRGADVSVFNSLKDEIVNKMGGVSLSLGTNYRSEAKLVNHFNAIFAEVFKPTGCDSLDAEEIVERFSGNRSGSYEASASNIVAGRTASVVEPVIEIATLNEYKPPKYDPSLMNREESEAEWIADKIESIISGHDKAFSIVKNGETVTPKPSDIGILYSKTKAQMPIERALRRRNIPYSVMESSSSTLEGLAYDLYSFLQVLVYPNDRKSYLALLLSPFARISNDGLSFLLNRKDDVIAFADDISFEDERDKESYISLKDLYLECKNEICRESICSTIERLYYSSGYRTYLMSSGYLAVYDEHFQYIWTLANEFDSNGENVISFLDYFRGLIGKAEKLNGIDIQKLDDNGVRMMTIHKSKGLEFPIVIIAGMGRVEQEKEMQNSIIDTIHNGKRFVAFDFLSENYANNIGFEIPDKKNFHFHPFARPFNQYNQKRINAERKRVLYVGFTRAINHLVLTYVPPEKNFMEKTLYAMYGDALNTSGEYNNVISTSIKQLRYGDIQMEYSKRRNSTWYNMQLAPTPIYHDIKIGVKENSKEEYDSSASYVGEELPDFDIEDILIKHAELRPDFGTLVHSALESSIKGEPFKEYRSSVLSDREEKRLSDCAIAIAKSFKSSTLYKELLSDKNLLAEVRFFYPDNERVLEGSADLLALGDDFNIVVDYKTDKHMNPDMHKGQLTTYARALSDLYGKKCYCLVYYVRDMSIGPIWDMDGNTIEL